MKIQPAVRKQHRLDRFNLLLDSATFVAFLVIMAPHWSGVAVHEWLSIAFAAAIVTHLLLNWQWIAGLTKRLLHHINWFARTNYVLDALLFISMTVAIFTGFMISESVLRIVGIATARWRLASTARALGQPLAGARGVAPGSQLAVDRHGAPSIHCHAVPWAVR